MKRAVTSLSLVLAACGAPAPMGTVSLKNGFDDPSFPARPPWTICKASYLGTEFGKVAIGETSAAQQTPAGLDFVLMVAAFGDPGCSAAKSLPLATRSEEELVSGQTRTITINLPNHQGPCPPEGVAPIPQAVYERILARYPEYAFKPYAERRQNPQCLP